MLHPIRQPNQHPHHCTTAIIQFWNKFYKTRPCEMKYWPQFPIALGIHLSLHYLK
jgi:hypothetical protein